MIKTNGKVDTIKHLNISNKLEPMLECHHDHLFHVKDPLINIGMVKGCLLKKIIVEVEVIVIDNEMVDLMQDVASKSNQNKSDDQQCLHILQHQPEFEVCRIVLLQVEWDHYHKICQDIDQDKVALIPEIIDIKLLISQN